MSRGRTGTGTAVATAGSSDGPVTTLLFGNSICDNGKFMVPGAGAQSGYQAFSHFRYLSALLGLSLVQPSGLPASSSMDSCGNFGIAGANLDALIFSASTQWFPPLDAAGVVPGLVIVVAATENDIVAGRAASAIKADAVLWARILMAKWPACRVQWFTPRPDNRISQSAAFATCAQEVYDYVMSLPGILGPRFLVADVRRTNALGNTWNIDPTKCLDAVTPTSGVHPNSKGALDEARGAVAVLQAAGIGGRDFRSRVVSSNPRQTGADAAVNGVFGAGSTVPTQSVILNGITGTAAGTTGWDTTAGANTTTAENPGWKIKMASAGSPQPWLIRNADPVIASIPRRMAPFVKVEIVSGGANIRSLSAAVQVVYSGGPTTDHWSSGLANDSAAPGYRDGEILTLYAPLLTPQIAAFGGAGTISVIRNWLYSDLLPNSTATVRILDIGMLATAAPAADLLAA